MPLPDRSTDFVADVRGLASALAVLQRQLARGTLPVGDGPPPNAGQPDGTPYLDRLNLRAYFRLGGAWRYVQLI